MKHFLKIGDYEPDELANILALSEALHAAPRPLLQHKNVLFVFEKPSLRTKVATEVAIKHLGGQVVHIEADVLLGAGNDPVFRQRESLADAMKNVSQWCDAIFARVFRHDTLQAMEQEAGIPVINALCNQHHPMQAMADLLTIRQKFGTDTSVPIAFVGDANNVAFSLTEIALMFGYEVRFAGPEKYSWSPKQKAHFNHLAENHNGNFITTFDPREAVEGAGIVYTDAFVSMGEEDQKAEKMKHFQPYQVDEDCFALAAPDAGFMHCLPAHRGLEVTDPVIDHPRSWVYQQAHNRMVVSKGLFTRLLNNIPVIPEEQKMHANQ